MDRTLLLLALWADRFPPVGKDGITLWFSTG